MSGKCTNEARQLIMKTIAWSLEVLSGSVLTIQGVWSFLFFVVFPVHATILREIPS